MPRAEAGSTKAISNKLKQNGLTRLRWYCQACEKPCRDENGFKCHVQSESHVRQMMVIGENSKKTIDNFSAEFLREFVTLLKTSHQEKKVNLNHFYQQVIANRHHIHMNATKWSSLSQFAGYLGREGICRVEETEKGLFISWIDNSPETLRRREAVLKKERQDKGDEEREQKQIQEQVERARRAELAKAEATNRTGGGEETQQDDNTADKMLLERKEGEKVKLNFGAPKSATTTTTTSTSTSAQENPATDSSESPKPEGPAKPAEKLSMSFSSGLTSKPKNVFSSAKKVNPLAGNKKSGFVPQQQKVSQQELIMRKEMEAREQKKRRMGEGVCLMGGRGRRFLEGLRLSIV
ncbi:domain of Kin17 curved DNA-binding protein-domain-containing protein [Talaromyces proteolyticus]|uniref:Domain of Kin17 curved DNA-binding protein-domain-containing protein n=1 Tax=Talaromyces proteolyticus TaxID=1131652 RepID=A0AAD4KGG8_9EURO|nr:domain of Kin17 curved DNA-binding protein-domain-containing protein [Talaromyces proteolyticus]KAH8689842.1 domain of Kin17 curved DNA-binding protein-domain-containing protein [Talaromyces proteolyticus]